MKVLIRGIAYPHVDQTTDTPVYDELQMTLTAQKAQSFVGLPILDQRFDKKLGEIIEVITDGHLLHIYAILDDVPLYTGLAISMNIAYPECIIIPVGVAIVPIPYYEQCSITSQVEYKIPSHREILAREIGHVKKG